MKLRNSEIHAIVQFVNQLDPPVGKSAYRFSGKTRYALAKNLRKLQVELDTLEALRQRLIDEHGLKRVLQPDGKLRLDGERYGEYEKAFQSALDAETEVDLHQISEEDLDLDANQIPVTVLSPLVGTLITAS